ncbi:MAG: GNAT family N-acetyltransferase [Oscillospiraceae bacterium]|nr:GNAT family N-acetyltransferase [Oscillospiraceae bacterium]
MISFERIKDPTLLTALWQNCFDDATEVIETFWRKTEGHSLVFAALDGETPVSMLCALPTELVNDCGETLRAAYLYAVCTAPAYRRRGLCAALLAYAENELRDYDACMLVPDGEAMFRYYEKRGYRTAFYHSRFELPARKSEAKITRLSADAYRALRELQLYGSFVSYDASLLALQQCASEASGAGLYRIETADTVCCAAAERWGDCLLFKELLPYCPEAAAALAEMLGSAKAIVRTQGGDVPFGMVKPLHGAALPEKSYLGFAFD